LNVPQKREKTNTYKHVPLCGIFQIDFIPFPLSGLDTGSISSLLFCTSRLTSMSETNIEIRKVQALTGERSFTIVLPKAYAIELGIEKGHFLKCHIEDQKLVLEKAEL
jgi:hypothetical protein